jgi:2-dehydropantoate 2-reductase
MWLKLVNSKAEADMHIVIFGAGGVGGYFGGRLAQAGEKVTFIARGDHLQAMIKNGLTVESIKGNFSVQPVTATDDISSLKDVAVVLVCVKTWDIPQAAGAILPILGPGTYAVPLENGVEAASVLAGKLGKDHVLGGLCRIASRIASPGVIQHTAIEPYVAFGELDNHPTERSQKLLQAFQRAGIMAEIPSDINLAVWQKFLFISAVSGLGAITRVPFGSFRSLDGTRQILLEALKECYAVGMALGVDLPATSPTDTLSYIDSLPAGTTASMQRDIIEGRPSELEAQNGAILRMGQKLNVPTPIHAFIYYSLLPQEILARRLNG